MSDTPPILLETNGLRGRTFVAPDFRVLAGETVVALVATRAMALDWADCALGLARPRAGTTCVLGLDLGLLPEKHRLETMARVACVSPPEGNLVANLKVWENMVLPAHYHGTPIDESLEATVVEALGAAGFGESWLDRMLPSPPDRLDPFESRVACLVRAALLRPALLFGEMLFDDLEPRHRRRLLAMLDWMRARQPELGVLLVAQSDDPDEEMGLIRDGHGRIITLEEVK